MANHHQHFQKTTPKQLTYAFLKTGSSQIKKPYCIHCKISGTKKRDRIYSSYSHWKPAFQARVIFQPCQDLPQKQCHLAGRAVHVSRALHPCFSVGLVLAFELGKSLLYRNVSHAARCFLSQALAGEMPVGCPTVVNTKSKKPSPVCKCPPGRALPPLLNTTAYCNLRTQGKVSISKPHLDCLAFLWALNHFFLCHFSCLPHLAF